jgi:hypothetical protein
VKANQCLAQAVQSFQAAPSLTTQGGSDEIRGPKPFFHQNFAHSLARLLAEPAGDSRQPSHAEQPFTRQDLAETRVTERRIHVVDETGIEKHAVTPSSTDPVHFDKLECPTRRGSVEGAQQVT